MKRFPAVPGRHAAQAVRHEVNPSARLGDVMVGTAYIEWVYNFYAGVYDVVFERFFAAGRRRAVAVVDPRPGERILEVGVGTGACISLFPKNIHFTGIDLSQGMLDEAHEKSKKEGWNHVRLLKMDATKLDFPDDSFDAVLAAYFITTVPVAAHPSTPRLFCAGTHGDRRSLHSAPGAGAAENRLCRSRSVSVYRYARTYCAGAFLITREIETNSISQYSRWAMHQ